MAYRKEAPTTAGIDLDEKVDQLQEKFYSAVKASQRFSWMGVFESHDQFQNPFIFIYLAERPHQDTLIPQSDGQANILTPFRELSGSLRSRVFVGLYYLETGDDNGNQLSLRAREDMVQRLRSKSYEPKAKILKQETFQVPVTHQS